MAKKEHLVINGYRVPGGGGGIAVRRACETVLANPGIKQSELLREAVTFSTINFSTAGWITSPGPKSPACILWDRRKVDGVFCCFPNEFTHLCNGAVEAAIAGWRSTPLAADVWPKAEKLKIGTLSVLDIDYMGRPLALFHGWMHKNTDQIFPTLDEAIDSMRGYAGITQTWTLPPWPAWSVNGKMLDFGAAMKVVMDDTLA